VKQSEIIEELGDFNKWCEGTFIPKEKDTDCLAGFTKAYHFKFQKNAEGIAVMQVPYMPYPSKET